MNRPFAGLAALVAIPALAQVQPGSSLDTPVVRAVRESRPAVVSITTEKPVQNPFGGRMFPSLFGDPFGDPFGDGRPGERDAPGALGSGVIIDAKGIVLTNEHVIHSASRIFVTTENGDEMEAEVIGTDSHSDLAVLRVKAGKPLPYLDMNNTRELALGESVIAIGNPFGMGITVTTGIVSAQNRTVQTGDSTWADFIQTDAAINPGNSGGALLDLGGRLVGINTAIRRNAEGIGFAIPIARARRVVQDLLTYGRVTPAWLGVLTLDPSGSLRRRLELDRRKGCVVRRTFPDLVESATGLREGDLILQVGSTPIDSDAALNTLLSTLKPGTELLVKFYRPGVGDKQTVITAARFPERLTASQVRTLVGLRAQPDGDALVVSEVVAGSPAAQLGLRKGDVLVRCNQTDLKTADDLGKALAQTLNQGSAFLAVARGRILYRVSVTY